jgi:hypothetical protein
MAVIAVFFLTASCEKELTSSLPQEENQRLIDPDAIAKNFLPLMQEENSQKIILDYLTENKFGGSLESIILDMKGGHVGPTLLKPLESIVQKSEDVNSMAEEAGIVQVPEIWLFKPERSFKSDEVLISFAPRGNEKSWESIKAYDLSGNTVYLDPVKEPNVPVIVVELNGMESLKLRVELMNKELRALGLQKRASMNAMFKSTHDLEISKINAISLKDDKEPWINGSAEIYAITSGIRGSEDNKEAEIQIVAMPYLDNDGQDYYPNQIILFWDDYVYQAANIQLYEQDSNYNYKELVMIITSGVFEITGILTAEPWVNALGKVASAIIEVMPDSWYTDDDDYVDSYYTLEKNKSYTNYYGAGANAKISMSPYVVARN